MAKTRSIKIAAINIAMHSPHSPQRYVSLFKEARRMNVLIQLGALHGAMLGILNTPSEILANSVVSGEIFRFVKLDAEEPWFNLQTSEQASDDDMSNVRIPPHLLPHLQRIEFVFLPYKHELWFVSQDRKERMGVSAAVDFFQSLFNSPSMQERFNLVEVTALPDMDTLDTMLSLHQLDKITMELTRPNPDDSIGDEERWLQRLESQNIRKQRLELVAVKGATIEPDAETRSLAVIAARNGAVSVVGRDATGLRVEESTKSKPMILNRTVDSDLETSFDVLVRTATGR